MWEFQYLNYILTKTLLWEAGGVETKKKNQKMSDQALSQNYMKDL